MSEYFEYLAQPGAYVNYKKWGILAACLCVGFLGGIALILFGVSFFPFSYIGAGLLMLGTMLAYRSLAARTEVEFEYCVADGTLQIDRIFGKRFRKPFHTVETRLVTRIATYNEMEAARYAVVTAAPKAREDLVSVFCREDGGEEYLLLLALDNETRRRLQTACPRARR